MATEALVPDLGLEQVESSGGEVQQPETTQQPDPKQADREYAQWVKGLKEDGEAGKYYRRIKDDYSRMQAISRLDPKGIDGIRERYSALDGIAYSEKKGLDAVSAMQSALAESQTALDAIAQGDVESLNEDQRAGLLGMTPALVNMLAETDPEKYTAAVLPHFVEALKGSELASSFNGLIDALNEKPPTWLRPEQKADWINERLTRVLTHADMMGKWFQAQDQRVKELGNSNGQSKLRLDGQQPEKTASTSRYAGVANEQFWETQVEPEMNAHAEATFDKELRQWSDKLAKAGFRLSAEKKTKLAEEFTKGVMQEAVKNSDYTSQIARYNRQRNPDKASVLSLGRKEFNTHASRVMKDLIHRDYGQLLDKRTAPKPNGSVPKPNGATPPIAPQKGVRIVTVKPQRSDIDFQRTPSAWIYDEKSWKRVLKDGSVVQFRP
jgi:hypothetical protein